MKPLNVLYEDPRLIAVSKPAGQLTIPGRGPSLEEPLREQVSAHIGGKAFVVHRLDREASGLVLFAKDAETHRRVSQQFESRRVKKTYLALVLGPAGPAGGTIDSPLREFGSGRMGVDPRGKASLTRYRVLERLPKAALLEVMPVTGRRHQIRVHLYSIGHPILGDARYGNERPVGNAPRLMLHACRMALERGPADTLTVTAPPTEDFVRILKDCGVHSLPEFDLLI
ncbi:MAG: RNA pseudouridine synthase [Elusimicrobia bacterium]|nr:RNA pseudouridine synthase [Elusimicrobiota bacterium]